MSDGRSAGRVLRFDEALVLALGAIRDAMPLFAPNGEQVLLVRDLLGCFRLFIDCPGLKDDEYDDGQVEAAPTEKDAALIQFCVDFAMRLGNFSPAPESLIQWAGVSFPRQDFFGSADAWMPLEGPDNLRVLDRLVTGREWLLPPTQNQSPTPPRAVFFGIKGGVGRTTALAMLAWHLSRLGKNVLVVDLDLESPGLGPVLLPSRDGSEEDRIIAGWPEFGVTDWFVEDAAGQADNRLLLDMIGDSPLASNGEIRVVPACGGLINQDYIAKLSRAYLDHPLADGAIELFGERLSRMLDQLEDYCQPDVVLLDCRAGLHDISSAALTRLGARNYLFAADTRQTWEGYRHLFHHWLRNPGRLRTLRNSLRTFAAMVPNGVTDIEYVRTFDERAHAVFQEIYAQESRENVGQTEEWADNFGPYDLEAPHHPVLIRFHTDFALFAPQERSVQLDESKIRSVFGDFLAAATSDLFPGEFKS